MTDFYEEQQKKVDWGNAVEQFIQSPVYLKLTEEMEKDVEALTKKLRKGSGDALEDDKIRAKLDVWEKWDSTIKSWLRSKQEATKKLASKGE